MSEGEGAKVAGVSLHIAMVVVVAMYNANTSGGI